MEIDKNTLEDLSICATDDHFSLLQVVDHCITSNGRDQLRNDLQTPLPNIEQIEAIQQTIQFIGQHIDRWPSGTSNGTIKVVEKFYETAFDPIPSRINTWNAALYKLLHSSDYLLLRYSVIHAVDFIRGNLEWVRLLLQEDTPTPLKVLLEEIEGLIPNTVLNLINKHKTSNAFSPAAYLQLGYALRIHCKQRIERLLQIHARIDAWYSMATAVRKLNLHFPDFVHGDQPILEAKELRHLLLDNPVAYDLTLKQPHHFLFLTGANMAGKSTFIKSVGVAVFLAHTGMAVPASHMQLSYFDGLLSNINITDNILKGESYFFNEVQRIKSTIQKVTNGKKWLILIDELFKGTNIQDAMKCSSLVIEGFLKLHNAAFILSTHLYEMGETLQAHPNIVCRYFETQVKEDQLIFSYQLKEGISNDRFGYMILKKEGVVKLLENIQG